MEKIKELINEIKEFGQLCKKNHLDSHSAAAAFFMFVSFIPLVIVVLCIIPFTPITDANILSIVESALPDRLDAYAADIVNQLSNESITALSVSAVVAMWSSSRALLTLKQGLNEIRGMYENRNFLMLRLDAAFYTLIFIISILLMFTLNVVFTGIMRYVQQVLGINIKEAYDFVFLIITLRPIITIIVSFLANLYFFTVLPNLKVTIKSQVPGAVLVSLIWYLFSTVFGIYINYYNAYSMYGSLSIVIMVHFYLYACMYILFLGGQFNYYLSLKRQNNTI